jgi:hypothetical protein
MSCHRHTEDSVSNESSPHNAEPSDAEPFDPAEALQGLYGDLIPLEALIHAASELLTELPIPKEREARRDYERVVALVMKAADDAVAILRYGTELMEALAIHLKRDRPAAEEEQVKRG